MNHALRSPEPRAGLHPPAPRPQQPPAAGAGGAATAIDYRRLAWLINNLGITPERLEQAVRDIAREGDKDGLARLGHGERRILDYALGEGLADLRLEQESMLRGVGLTLSTFRNEARAYQRAYARVSRLTIGALIALGVLNLAAIGLLLFAPSEAALRAGTLAFAETTGAQR